MSTSSIRLALKEKKTSRTISVPSRYLLSTRSDVGKKMSGVSTQRQSTPNRSEDANVLLRINDSVVSFIDAPKDRSSRMRRSLSLEIVSERSNVCSRQRRTPKTVLSQHSGSIEYDRAEYVSWLATSQLLTYTFDQEVDFLMQTIRQLFSEVKVLREHIVALTTANGKWIRWLLTQLSLIQRRECLKLLCIALDGIETHEGEFIDNFVCLSSTLDPLISRLTIPNTSFMFDEGEILSFKETTRLFLTNNVAQLHILEQLAQDVYQLFSHLEGVVASNMKSRFNQLEAFEDTVLHHCSVNIERMQRNLLRD